MMNWGKNRKGGMMIRVNYEARAKALEYEDRRINEKKRLRK
jgi:hypothetical protein